MQAQGIANYRKDTMCVGKDTSINSPISEMEYITLCAGEGLIGKVEPQQFQDSPKCFNQLSKRWHKIKGTYAINAAAEEITTFHFSIHELQKAAAKFPYYAAFRGSVNLLVEVVSSMDKIQAEISTTMGTDFLTSSSRIDPSTKTAIVTIPWTAATFIGPLYDYDVQQIPKVFFHVTNFDGVTRDFDFTLSLCVGDDWHYGIFTGVSTLPVRITPTAQFDSKDPIVYHSIPETFTVKKPTPHMYKVLETIPESGILGEINTALENTIPIVEKVSMLASLLDAHMITKQPEPILPKTLPNTIATDNIVFTERLFTTNHNGMSLPDKECFGVEESETNIYKLLTETKSWIDAHEWTDSMPAGTVIAEYPAGPVVGGTPVGNLHDTFPSHDIASRDAQRATFGIFCTRFVH